MASWRHAQLTPRKKATKMKPLRNHYGAGMASITFKNIPDDLYEQLKKAASANHRSVNSELLYCLERAYKPTPISAAALAQKASDLRRRVAGKRLSAADITAAKEQGRA